MPQSGTRDVGLDVHQESIAVAEVVSVGTIETRQSNLDKRIGRLLRRQSSCLALTTVLVSRSTWSSYF
jgi:hypothetical protein